MKKVYAKLTKERAAQFQIETAIYELADNSKVVEKRPLTTQAKAHVKRMCDHYNLFLQQGSDCFLSCEMNGDSVRFPFISGQSFYDKVIKAAQAGSKENVLSVFHEYQELLQKLYPTQQPFAMSQEFISVFGDDVALDGMAAASHVNIDLTLDNIVVADQKISILDYEWIFDFMIPVKFPVYRAIYALYVKDAALMENVLDRNEVYDMFSISVDERKMFAQMNVHFMEYVEGYGDSYQKLLVPYRKPEINLGKGNHADEYAQIYWGTEGGYSEHRMQNYSVKADGMMRMEIDIHAFENTDMIRIDPCNWPGMIRVHRLEAETSDTVKKLSPSEFDSNAMDVASKVWVFQSSDPQIIIPVNNAKWEKIVFIYELVMGHLEDYEEYAAELANVHERNLERWKAKVESQQMMIEKQNHLLAQCAHRMQLLEDKLAYIENTKAFKAVLKKKVDNIRIWDDLNQ